MVTISSISKLDYKMDYLVVRNSEKTTRIHLSEISVLILESTAISLTSYLLCELSKRKIDVVFCDEKRLPYATMALLYGSHDTSLKYREQIKWTDYQKQAIWTEIVGAKILGQSAVLKYYGKSEYQLLDEYITQIELGDITNREGHSAKVYFNALFGMDFSRSQENNINAALNYGYGIILSVFAREVVSRGYATQFGIFHDNMFNKLNLACDFMEPFRPFVDFTVSKMDLSKFEHEEKMRIIKLLNRKIIIDNTEQYLLNAIKIFVKSCFNALEDNDLSLINFPKYELQIYENDNLF